MNEVLSAVNKTLYHYKYVVIGELHGVRENVWLLERILDDPRANAKDSLAFAFEWPLTRDECRVLNDYVLGSIGEGEKRFKEVIETLYQQESGIFSDQYLSFIRKMREVNEQRSIQPIRVIAFDPDYDQWNSRDAHMAEYIRKESENINTVIAVTGDVHARKQPFQFGDDEALYRPLALHLPHDKTFSFKLQYKKGQFYNFGIQNMYPPSDETSDSDYYDAVYTLEEATPVSITPTKYL